MVRFFFLNKIIDNQNIEQVVNILILLATLAYAY